MIPAVGRLRHDLSLKPDWVAKLRPCLKTPTITEGEHVGAKDRSASEAEKKRGLAGGGAEEEEEGEWDGDKAREGKTGKETRQEETSHPGDSWRERKTQRTPE